RGALLADRDVDAADLPGRVAAVPVLLLVEDRVDADGGLAGLPVADDELTLAAADRRQRVDRLDAGLHRLLHRLPLHHTRRRQLQLAPPGRLDLALAVDRVAQRVHDPTEVGVADRDRQHLAGTPDLLALFHA